MVTGIGLGWCEFCFLAEAMESLLKGTARQVILGIMYSWARSVP